MKIMDKSIKGSKTERNVALSFANESMTVNRYSIFSKAAFKEGLNEAGGAFAEISGEEKRHAETLFKFFEGGTVELKLTLPLIPAGSTRDNIANSITVENAAWNVRYPEFAKTAWEESFSEIAWAFENFARDEKSHEEKFRKLLDSLGTSLS